MTRRRGLSPVATRLAQRPRLKDGSRFLAELRHPARISAARAVVDGLVVSTTLKKRGVRSLLPAASAASHRLDPGGAAQVSRAVDAGLALLPFPATCLRRSVTLVRELDRLGLAAKLHIGVRTVAGAVEAHAWVQVGDEVVNDDPAITSTYVELAAGDLERIFPLLP